MTKRRPVTSLEKVGAFCIGILLLVVAYYAPLHGLFGNRVRGRLLALGFLLSAGGAWTFYRKRSSRG